MSPDLSTMARGFMFPEPPSRRLSFFHRTFGSGHKRLEPLFKQRKQSVNMGSLTDEQVVEFFTKERIREESKNSPNGEVPDIFRTHHFFVSIEGEKWIHPRDWKEANVSARVYIKNSGSEMFTHLLQTESITGECSPKFIICIPFRPLSMRNSQNNAITTILRIDTYAKDRRFASIHVSLAQLLWDRTYKTRVEPLRQSFFIRSPMKASTVKLNVSSGRSIDEEVDDCEIDFNIQISRSVWTQAQESKLFLAVCSVAGYGQWTRSYVSEMLMKPSRKAVSGQFLAFRLERGDLTGYNHKNPVRIELRGSRKGVSVVHGFVQFVLPNVSTKCFIPWSQTQCSHLSASVALDVIVSSPRHLVMSLHIVTTVREAQTPINIKTEGAKIGGHEEYLTGTEIVSPKEKSYDDTYGSSSESSEPSSGYSLTQNKKVVLKNRPEPEYYVTFPSPL